MCVWGGGGGKGRWEGKWVMGGRVQCGSEWVPGKVSVCVCVGEEVVGKVSGWESMVGEWVGSWGKWGGVGWGGGSGYLQFAPVFLQQ